ncbi:hypothetical protein [uncultured Cocleimonas sp.]|uniref:hypothetical protein n=1 Tax=uncultured Cocleimonas sp. TaxID=1051587 RepID=UPI0026099BBB|nr:hypothetical protein [uncultured Cocleimonas sp.]
MSYDQFLYKCNPETPSINEWTTDLSLPIGDKDVIKAMFENILGKLKWNESEDGNYWSQGCFTDHGFEISVQKSNNIISLRGCSQLQAIDIAKKIKLSAYDPQTGEQLVLIE